MVRRSPKPATASLALKRISRWTAGYNEAEHLVAVLMVTETGEALSIALPPETAMEMGEELAEAALHLMRGAGRPN